MCGDLNMKNINWDNLTFECGDGDYNNQRKLLLDFAENHFLEQKVREPTRLENILDLVFDNSDSVDEIVMEIGGGLSDHNTMIIKTNITVNIKKKEPMKYLYHSEIQKYDTRDKSDEEWEKYKKNLSEQNWPEDEEDIDVMYKVLVKNMEIAVSKTFEIKENKNK